ncbi:phosphoadenosine phosphosulfate reductase [Yoonia sp. 208BN28-4]|uniref:phosphoadenosine phosphosulfate reductase n=1 Tax=Yoonia sp. 208BN28-4 TaxID=3126505 RepID=UPI0030EDEC0E
MKDTRIAFESGLKGLEPDLWVDQLDAIADDLGYFEPLGDNHMVAFIDAGPKLLVTFEDAEIIRKHYPDAEPRGFKFVREEGWSHLAIISDSESWFRDPAIFGYFDRLIDDGFFEDFDKVLFHGANAAGYAAAAYSVAAPGCTVLAIRPQATLDPRITGFDPRHTEQRRNDFTSRYGYAPDMIDATQEAFIAFDPLLQMDAVHAALFTRKNMTPLRCVCMGDRLEFSLDELDIHNEMIRNAMDDTLDTASFAKLIRARRSHIRYRRGLFSQMIRRDHPVLAANVAAYVLREGPDGFFSKKLEELLAKGHNPTIPFNIEAAE